MTTPANGASGRPVTVWFQRRALRRLDQAAQKLGVSRSDLMRIAIDARVAAVLDGADPERVELITAAAIRRTARAAVVAVGGD